MINDLFVTTRGDYFDIASDAEGTANWLQNHGVDRLVYLDNDAGSSFGLALTRAKLEGLNSVDAKEYFGTLGTLQKKREYIYGLESLEKLREVAQYCGSSTNSNSRPTGPASHCGPEAVQEPRVASSGWSQRSLMSRCRTTMRSAR